MTEQRMWLIRMQSAPYDDQRAALGVDAALACGAFGQSAAVVFEGPARRLLSEQAAPPGADRNLHKLIASFPLYDLHRVYAVAEHDSQLATEATGDLEVITISPADVSELISTSRHVLSF